MSASVSLADLLGSHRATRPGADTGSSQTRADTSRADASRPDVPDFEPADDATAVPPDAARLLVAAGARLDQRGWVPATAGNLSLRLPDGRIAITCSGCHKGELDAGDLMLVDPAGAPLSPGRPSAETLLHCQVYRRLPAAGAVLHGHSVAATVLSMHLRTATSLSLEGYEVCKAFEGIRRHDVPVGVPILDNDQDIARLAAALEPWFDRSMPGGYVIRGHGVYAWGADMPTALARLEALEFLLACELEKTRLT